MVIGRCSDTVETPYIFIRNRSRADRSKTVFEPAATIIQASGTGATGSPALYPGRAPAPASVLARASGEPHFARSRGEALRREGRFRELIRALTSFPVHIAKATGEPVA